MISTILSLLFSKIGALAVGAAGLFFLLWRKKAAEQRAERAEAQVRGYEKVEDIRGKQDEIHKEESQEVSHAQEVVETGDPDAIVREFDRVRQYARDHSED